ncbi:MAG: hypothetical protein QXI12_10780 [Candidatus Methanomethyliaceae archaeon]
MLSRIAAFELVFARRAVLIPLREPDVVLGAFAHLTSVQAVPP